MQPGATETFFPIDYEQFVAEQTDDLQNWMKKNIKLKFPSIGELTNFPVRVRKKSFEMRLCVGKTSNWSEKVQIERPKHMLLTLYSPKRSYLLKIEFALRRKGKEACHSETSYDAASSIQQQQQQYFGFQSNLFQETERRNGRR